MGRSIYIYAFPWSMNITKENYGDNPEGIKEDDPEWHGAWRRWWDERQEKYLVGEFGSSYLLACWFRKRFSSGDWSYDFAAEATAGDLKALIADLGSVLNAKGLKGKVKMLDELFPSADPRLTDKSWAQWEDDEYALHDEISYYISRLKPIAEMEGVTFIYDE